ncbi:MAG: NAD(P)H-hydrate dehydratase [Dehalococcoidia bacterium]|nr:NAD(P)H-hydrate dehydratase [Dehalococcoidia bacterium]
MKIVTAQQMREIEDRAEAGGVSKDVLMENAGLAVADYIRGQVRNLVGMTVVVLVGPGNNGGDGLVAARHLDAWGARVTICLCRDNPAHRGKVDFLRGKRVTIIQLDDDDGAGQLRESLQLAQIVLDAILGTGRSRPITGTTGEALELLREVRAANETQRLMALDVPTGLDADTGAVDPKTVPSDETLTLGNPKAGLYRFPGAEYAGKIEVLDIGIPNGVDSEIAFELMTDDWTGSTLPDRPMSGHKGTFGKVLIVGGSTHYVGAPYLAATAAGRVGAGLVTLAVPQSLQMAIAAKAVEPTYLPLPEESPGVPQADAAGLIAEQAEGYQALLIGPGIGQADSTRELVTRLLLNSGTFPPLVIDADGLNILASSSEWWNEFSREAILTPHPGEMARLTGLSTKEIQERRVEIAVESAEKWRKIVVLKGAFTVVAYPDGSSRLSPFANPAMATAGTGDVLAGTIAGLLAQGVEPEDAAALGVYLHGLAGERASADLGDAGMLAVDLLPELPRAIRDLRRGRGTEERRTPWRT